MMNSSRIGLLFVDDEEKSHRYFRQAFSPRYEVWTASNVKDALLIMNNEGHRIAVVISDQRMPQATGIDLFREVQKKNPGTVRILTTAYTEIDVLVDAINEGSVFAFVTKPWQLDTFTQTVDRAVEKYQALRERQQLVEKKLNELRELIIHDKVLESGTIAANLGHFIHNALFPVILFLEEMISGNSSPTLSKGMSKSQRDLLLAMKDHIKVINDTLEHLEESAHVNEISNGERVDIAEILKETARATSEMRDTLKIEMGLSLPEESVFCTGNAKKFRALFNLIFAEELSSLSTGCRFFVDLENHPDSGLISVTVKDDKPHVVRGNSHNLFRPFHSRSNSPQDLGIFLAAAYVIVRSLGGTVKSSFSDLGGLTFTFTFPTDAAGQFEFANC
jgi:FixJ family two-component response regulator